MSKSKVVVLFRAEKRGQFKGNVTAVFPQMQETTFSFACYAHVGQHGTCSRTWYMMRTRAAKPAEYAALARELRAIGYDLDIRQRWTRKL